MSGGTDDPWADAQAFEDAVRSGLIPPPWESDDEPSEKPWPWDDPGDPRPEPLPVDDGEFERPELVVDEWPDSGPFEDAPSPNLPTEVWQPPRVLYAYLDESFAEGHFYVAGFVVDGLQHQRLSDELQAFMQWGVAPRFGIPWETELHGNEIMQGKKGWKCLRGRVDQALWVYESALSVLEPIGARTFIQGVDTERLKRQYGRHAHSPYLVTLRHALERIDSHAKTQGYNRVQIIADHVDDHRIYQAAVSGYKQDGTPGYQRSRLELTAEQISFQDSRFSYGLQMADLVAYISRRHLEAPASTPRNSKRAAERLYRYVWNRIAAENSRRTKWIPG